MPIYSYRCAKGHEFDRYAAITAVDEPQERVQCPTCRRNVQAELVPARTAKPILKAGRGGFYNPSRA